MSQFIPNIEACGDFHEALEQYGNHLYMNDLNVAEIADGMFEGFDDWFDLQKDSIPEDMWTSGEKEYINFKLKNIPVKNVLFSYDQNGNCCEVFWHEQDNRFQHKDVVVDAITATNTIPFASLANNAEKFYFQTGYTYAGRKIDIFNPADGSFSEAVIQNVTSTSIVLTTAVTIPAGAVLTLGEGEVLGGMDQYDCDLGSPSHERRATPRMTKVCAPIVTMRLSLKLNHCDINVARNMDNRARFKKYVVVPSVERFFKDVEIVLTKSVLRAIWDAQQEVNPSGDYDTGAVFIHNLIDCCGSFNCDADIVKWLSDNIFSQLETSGSKDFVALCNVKGLKVLSNLGVALSEYQYQFLSSTLVQYNVLKSELFSENIDLRNNEVKTISLPTGGRIELKKSKLLQHKTSGIAGTNKDTSVIMIMPKDRFMVYQSAEIFSSASKMGFMQSVSNGYATIYMGDNVAKHKSSTSGIECPFEQNGSFKFAPIVSGAKLGGYQLIVGLNTLEGCTDAVACGTTSTITLAPLPTC